MSTLKEKIIKYVKKTYEYPPMDCLPCTFHKQKEINFNGIEKKLGFSLHQSIKDYYSAYSITIMWGYLKVPKKDIAQFQYKNNFYLKFRFDDTRRVDIMWVLESFIEYNKKLQKNGDKWPMISIASTDDDALLGELCVDINDGSIYYAKHNPYLDEKEYLKTFIKLYNSLDDLFCDMTKNLRLTAAPDDECEDLLGDDF